MKITFDGVSVDYGRRQILKDVSFTAERGEITAIIGRNGAGKSTLLSCLAGEKRDYQGHIFLEALDARTLREGQRARAVAYLPQVLPRPSVTVRELAAFGRAPYASLGGRLSSQDREAAERAVEAVGLASLADAFVDHLSGGERKKAFFAMTLAQDTPAILLDEPTAHLDVASRFEFMELLRRMRDETGKTFLTVMHELPEVLRCADRIVAIHEGRQVFCGTADQCLAAEIPERCFGVRVLEDGAGGYSVKPAV